jgi:hypothetical protein
MRAALAADQETPHFAGIDARRKFLRFPTIVVAGGGRDSL